MKLIPTTETEIQHVIESLKLKNSAWYEEISSRILKYSTHTITKPLSHICNASLNQGIYPDRIKLAIVQLIYKKKEEKTDVANYRPISLLTPFTKNFGKSDG
jgi:hypothetical protein